MGSSNGVTRGQLRPYFSGRTPPFILVGTLIILIIFGFSYWSLNSQYNDLQVELHEFQDQLRAAAQKRLENEKHSSSLQDQLLSARENSAKCKTGLEKKEEEIAAISQQLRDDLTGMSAQFEEKRMSLEKCEEDKLKKEGECSRQQEHAKQLGEENDELKKMQETLKEKINALEIELQQHAEEKVKKPLPTPVPNPDAVTPKETNKVEDNETLVKSKNVELPVPVTPLNPDVGIPPGGEGGNDIQENAPPKSNLPQQKDVLVPAEMANNDAKGHNGAQLALAEDPKNNIDIPQQPFSPSI